MDSLNANAARERWLLVLLPLCAALPLLIPEVPPLTDLGAHLGRLAVQLDRGADPVLAGRFSFRWALVPNLGTDLLVQALAPLVGLEPALKLVVAAIPALHVLGVLLLSRVVHGRITPAAIFAVPLAYGLLLHFGFINFALGVALGLLSLSLWIHLGRIGRTRLRTALFLPIGLALWVCHLAAWAVFCVLAAAQALVAVRDRGCSAALAAWRTALTVVPLGAGPLLGILTGTATGEGPVEYGGLGRKATWLQTALWDRWPVWDRISATVLIGLALWFWLSRRFEADRGLGLGGLLLAAIFMVLPFGAAGSFYLDMRLVPVTLTLLLVATRPFPDAVPAMWRTLMLAALAFAGARLAGNALSLRLAGEGFAQSLRLVARIPEDAQLVTLYSVTCATADLPNPERRAHLGGYALARRHAFDNAQFIQPGGQLLQLHNPAAGAFENNSGLVLAGGDCTAAPLLADVAGQVPQAMGHLWVVAIDPGTRLPGWIKVASSGDSVLYRRAAQEAVSH